MKFLFSLNCCTKIFIFQKFYLYLQKEQEQRYAAYSRNPKRKASQ